MNDSTARDLPASNSGHESWLDVAGARAVLQTGNKLLASFGPDLNLIQPYMQRVVVQPGQVLARPSEPVRHVYFLHEGVVSELAAFANGVDIEVALVGREGAVGATAFVGMPLSITRDVCHVEARASRVPLERLVEACRRSQIIEAAIVRYTVWKLSCAQRCGACNACHTVEQRLCRWLLMCADVLESGEIGLPQDVYAKMVGAQRTRINPILQDLRGEGVVSLSRSRLKILDRSALRTRSCECYELFRRDREMLSF